MNDTHKDHIIVFSRDTLDETITARLGMKISSTDDQWNEVVDYFHNDDDAWGYIINAVDQAVEECILPMVQSMEGGTNG